VTRLILVGGGHAHLHVVERIATSRRQGDGGWDGVDVVLVSAYPAHHYSGMLPGYLQGRYREEELRFDLVALARVAGIRFVQGWVRRVELLEGMPGSGSPGRAVAPVGRIHTDEEVLDFHLASLDVGSVAGGASVPGVREYAVALRPTSRAVELTERLERLRSGSPPAPGSGGEPEPRPVRAVVVGAGAAGFEVAVAVAERLHGERRPRARVTMVEAGPSILPEFSERVRRRGLRELARWGIQVRTDTRVTRVDGTEVQVEGSGGSRRPPVGPHRVGGRCRPASAPGIVGSAPGRIRVLFGERSASGGERGAGVGRRRLHRAGGLSLDASSRRLCGASSAGSGR